MEKHAPIDPHHDQSQQPIDESAPGGIKELFPAVRYIFALPVLATLVASLVLLVLGFIETFNIILELFHAGGHLDLAEIKVHFIDVIDIFLLATIFFVISIGFWQLFISHNLKLDPWLKVDDVHDLEIKLIGVLITILGVLGLASVATWDGVSNLLPYGVTIALLIAGLSYYASRSQH